MGKNIGEGKHSVYVNSRSAGEYSHPSKDYKGDIFKVKMRAGTELDNMMTAAIFDTHKPMEERHPEFPNGWDIYYAQIHFDNDWYVARISVGIDDKMRRRFYEANISKMESTDTVFGSVRFITPPNSISASTDTISESKEDVNDKFSLKANPGSEENRALFDNAKRIFGTTYNWNTAGYILPDGTRLDFSGKREGSSRRGSARTRTITSRAMKISWTR